MSERPPAAGEESPGETALLLQYLQKHDAFCPLCKYNLRNLMQPRCPECGRAIKLTVGLTEPHLRAVIMLIVALSLSAAAGILCVVLIIVEGFRVLRWPSDWDDLAGFIMILGSVLSIIPAGAGIALHRRIMRLPLPFQYGLAGAAILWDILLFVLYLALVFRLFH